MDIRIIIIIHGPYDLVDGSYQLHYYITWYAYTVGKCVHTTSSYQGHRANTLRIKLSTRSSFFFGNGSCLISVHAGQYFCVRRFIVSFWTAIVWLIFWILMIKKYVSIFSNIYIYKARLSKYLCSYHVIIWSVEFTGGYASNYIRPI